jgi:hypothetical protein
MPGEFKVVKIGNNGDTAPPTPLPKAAGKKITKPRQTRRKSMKTYPRGIIKGSRAKSTKFEAVRDPAKPPPLTKSSTLRILTEKGAEHKRQSIRKTVRTMSDGKVKQTLRASGYPVSDKTPPEIARQILEGGVEAGMIVAK